MSSHRTQILQVRAMCSQPAPLGILSTPGCVPGKGHSLDRILVNSGFLSPPAEILTLSNPCQHFPKQSPEIVASICHCLLAS